MKKIIFLIFLVCVFLLLMKHPSYSKIAVVSLDDVQKATLTDGLKATFCEVTTIKPEEILTMYEGTPPKDFYSNMYNKAQCEKEHEEKEIIIGEVKLEHQSGYESNDTFFIFENTMYRAGMHFYEYYDNKNQGGTYEQLLTKNTIKGLEVVGTSYFFNSEYDKNFAIGDRLEDSGFITHYDTSGKNDWNLLAINNHVYKLTKVLKEEHDVVLLNNTSFVPTQIPSEISPQPDRPSDINLTATPPLTPTLMNPEDVGLTIQPTSDKKSIIMRIEDPSFLDTVEYELSYDAIVDGQIVTRGTVGTVNTKNSIPILEQIHLGTCTNGRCVNDQGVKNVEITIRVKFSNGTTEIIKQPINIE